MGYYSTVYGEITFDPPANHQEIQKIESALAEAQIYKSLELCVYTEQVDTNEGILTRRTAETICSPEEPGRHYTLVEELKIIVSNLPDRTFEGCFEISGEDDEDLWRLRVKNGEVEEVRPQIIWPD